MARSRHVTLLILAIVMVIAYTDRQLMSVLIEPMRHDLKLSDTSLGLLNGTAFFIFYATASFPIARWADHGDRKLLISLCVFIWSIATSLCGIASNFTQLLLARVGVAAGEAGSTPVAQSLLGDLYPVRRHAAVMGVINAAIAIGLGVGLGLGGYLASRLPWREVFVIVGAPGALVALIFYLFGIEPRRASVRSPIDRRDAPSFLLCFSTLWRLPGFPWIFLTASVTAIVGTAYLVWGPSFFVRIHGQTLAQAGFGLAIATIAGLMGGSLFSGWLCDFAGRRDARWYAWISAAGIFLAFPCALGVVLWPTAWGGYIFFFLMKFAVTAYNPAVFALVLGLAPSNMRTMAAMLINLAISLFGQGVAPLVIGAISDALVSRVGDQSLLYSLLLIACLLPFAGICALFVGKGVPPLPLRGTDPQVEYAQKVAI